MKRLIICADGTWDTPDIIDKDKKSAERERTRSSNPEGKTLYTKPVREPTNVVKMARAIKPTAKDKTQQVVYYDTGVGTGLGLYDKLFGGGFGVGLSNNILQCYRFLVHNYEKGDEIFLFGFSRGAFTVRSLAGMLHRCGLLTKDDAYYIPEAYEHYLLEDNDPAFPVFRKGKGFRNRNHPTRQVKIKFIGVWDTVGALGLPFHGPLSRAVNQKYAFHNVQLSPSVEFAYQALAIDEWRKPFEATLWDPAAAPPKGQTIEQRWFAGCHSNVGGGLNADYFPDKKGKKRAYRLENYAFQWMVKKAAAKPVGLECDMGYVKYFDARPDCSTRNSLTGFYKLWGKHLRPIGKTKYGNETVDESVMERMKEDSNYKPDNL
jgi:hypothetical protein